MSTVAQQIGEYVADLKFEDLGEDVLDYAKRILLDSFACAYGGADSEPAQLTRATARELSETGPATIWADGSSATAPLAALANGVAIRYQDYNDVYFGPAWTAHPSDNIATLFAVAEWQGCTGADFCSRWSLHTKCRCAFPICRLRKISGMRAGITRLRVRMPPLQG